MKTAAAAAESNENPQSKQQEMGLIGLRGRGDYHPSPSIPIIMHEARGSVLVETVSHGECVCPQRLTLPPSHQRKSSGVIL